MYDCPQLLLYDIPAWVGSPDYGAIIAGYVGLILMGGIFVAIGLLVSAVTKNQIVAARHRYGSAPHTAGDWFGWFREWGVVLPLPALYRHL